MAEPASKDLLDSRNLLSPEFLSLQDAVKGRYSLERELGRGGMGIVLLARDVALDRLVAIKLLPPMLAANPERRERFLREARTAAGLSHPNIIPIHSVEEHGELVFFVMGYVDGETLRDRVGRTGPLTPREVMRMVQEVAWALSYAHQRGVVHRDIKPENIMLDQASGRALVADFGIARVQDRDEPDDEGHVVGTARYMSPEQAAGEPAGPQSDLYSLGATAFFALTGRAPFEATNLPALLAKHVTEPAPAVAKYRPGVPAKLSEVVERCLAKAPEGRYESGEALAGAIGEMRGRELRAPPLIRGFLRNAEVTTAVFLTAALIGQNTNNINGLANFIMIALLVQLVAGARRLLNMGYSFDDIRAALLAEASALQEEAEAAGSAKFMRRINGLWNRLWAGKFGRFFFRVAGTGMKKPKRRALPSSDATEIVLGRAANELFADLPSEVRHRMPEVPEVIGRLERDAERLRARGDAGEQLETAVAALENVRLGLLKVKAGVGTMEDLTLDLERANEIGDKIDAELAARREVRELLR
ncbi:MAG: serine/threonine-protein kinase [Gemmatimonadales bacterium]